jgi:hypothetical protein
MSPSSLNSIGRFFMANSQQLREINNGRIKFSKEAEVLQERVQVAVSEIREELLQLYPKIIFTYKKEISKNEIKKIIKSYNSSCGSYIANDESSVNPDGGFLFGRFNGKNKLILTVESKKQGTPASAKGSKGNAIERTFKNYNETILIQLHEKIFPYVLFVSGSDFEEGSSIRDRLTSMNLMRPFNQIELNKIPMGKNNLWSCASVFLKPDSFQASEIYDVSMDMCNKAIGYYLAYGN